MAAQAWSVTVRVGLRLISPSLPNPRSPDMHARPAAGAKLRVDDDLLQPGDADRYRKADMVAGRQRLRLRERRGQPGGHLLGSDGHVTAALLDLGLQPGRTPGPTAGTAAAGT